MCEKIDENVTIFGKIHVFFNIHIISCHSHPETSSGGGQIPEMIQVCDYDILIVLGELNTLI